ncbi:Cyclin-dependent kinase 10 [Entophlyctis sp. JEL0112]|nr:Cyclin-dependent kinase 10 [Entophlyctis sp. JEL0112]
MSTTTGVLTSVSLARAPGPDPAVFLGACASVSAFEKLGRVGEGTYGIVYKARDTKSGQIVALKRVRMEREKDGLPLSSLREVSLLRSLRHENIVRVHSVCVGNSFDQIFMASLMDNVISRLRPNKFLLAEVKCLILQLLTGLDYLHENHIIHRSAGCILAELFKNRPLLPGRTEANQLALIAGLLGSATPRIWPGMARLPHVGLLASASASAAAAPGGGFSTVRSVMREAGVEGQGVELVLAMLVYDPEGRVDAKTALRHPYFRREGPNPCFPESLRMRIPKSNSEAHSISGRMRDERYEVGGSVRDLKRRFEHRHEEGPRFRDDEGMKLQRVEDELLPGAMPFRQFDLSSKK